MITTIKLNQCVPYQQAELSNYIFCVLCHKNSSASLGLVTALRKTGVPSKIPTINFQKICSDTLQLFVKYPTSRKYYAADKS